MDNGREQAKADKKSSRNPWIELLRFAASVCIACYHYEYLCLGQSIYLTHFYIWVEFFFVLSGFFLAANAQSKKFKNSYQYVWHELKKLYPTYFFGYVLSVVIYVYVNHASVLRVLWQSKTELLLLTGFGYDSGALLCNLGGPGAYVGCMLLASFFLFYLIQNHRKVFMCLIGPLAALLGYTFLIKGYGNLSQWMNNDYFVAAGLVRAMAGMSVGALFYLLNRECAR